MLSPLSPHLQSKCNSQTHACGDVPVCGEGLLSRDGSIATSPVSTFLCVLSLRRWPCCKKYFVIYPVNCQVFFCWHFLQIWCKHLHLLTKHLLTLLLSPSSEFMSLLDSSASPKGRPFNFDRDEDSEKSKCRELSTSHEVDFVCLIRHFRLLSYLEGV